LQQPPEAAPLLPELRTVGGAPVEKPSVNLIETIQHALQRQAWYADYQQEQGGQTLAFVGKFKVSTSPRTVAADIRQVLGVDLEQGQRQSDVYHRELIQAAEQAGILVMRSGIVGNNTRRKLDVGEYRHAGSKNSMRLAKAVIAEAFSGRLLLRVAGKLRL
jgi:hypothetical protein